MKNKDYTGQIGANGWKAIADTERVSKDGHHIWKIQCVHCGKLIENSMRHFHDGIKQCSCQKRSTTQYFIEGEEVRCVTSKGDIFYISLIDLEKISSYSWCKSGNGYFVARDIRKPKNVSLHSLIMETPEGLVVDHIDRNPANNRRSNLRICRTIDNMQNISPRMKKEVNVTYDKQTGKWAASIRFLGKKLWLGRHDTKEEAITVVLQKKEELNSPYFPK